MIELTGNVGDILKIGDDIAVEIIGNDGCDVRVQITAPPDFIVREELVAECIGDEDYPLPVAQAQPRP